MAKVFIENHICLRYNDRCEAMTWQAVYIFHCIALLVKLVSILMFGQEYAYIFYWIYLVTVSLQQGRLTTIHVLGLKFSNKDSLIQLHENK